MAWVTKFEMHPGDGRIQPTQVVGNVKVFEKLAGVPIVQIDTLGSTERKLPGKTSQTLQFDREAAHQLFLLLKRTYDF